MQYLFETAVVYETLNRENSPSLSCKILMGEMFTETEIKKVKYKESTKDFPKLIEKILESILQTLFMILISLLHIPLFT